MPALVNIQDKSPTALQRKKKKSRTSKSIVCWLSSHLAIKEVNSFSVFEIQTSKRFVSEIKSLNLKYLLASLLGLGFFLCKLYLVQLNTLKHFFLKARNTFFSLPTGFCTEFPPKNVSPKLHSWLWCHF